MIPVHAPVFDPEDFHLVQFALNSGEISGTFGRFITEFEERFAEFCGCNFGIAVSSGTTALHLAAAVLGIGRGDEVLMNACTNIATANAVVQQGGIVVPIDSEPDTWNMRVDLLEDAITSRARAIMPVHIYGHPVDMDRVMEIAHKYELRVIEDCAEAHGAEYRGRRVGSFGDFGCFSFYANKVITTGEGGMLVTNDPQLAEQARSLRNLGFGIPRFVHHEMGFNYRMTNVQAAIGVGQLSRIEQIIERKRHIAQMYLDRLADVPGLRLPVEADYARSVYWMFGVVLEPEFGVHRDDFAAELLDHGVDTRTMFCPMNQQPALLKRGAVKRLACPVADFLWTNGLYLPSGNGLTESEIDGICHLVQEMSPACA
jgi:perosamine synthetase